MKVRIILDSGAFTAWTRKKSISITDYIKFTRKNEKYIYQVVNLDSIPGEFGRSPTVDEREKAAQLGWDNLEKMRDGGINPIHVYHQGESAIWLDRMIDSCDYIGVAPRNKNPTKKKREWLDRVFSRFIEGKAIGKVQAHGFGMTSVPLISRYPWGTADSVSWIRAAVTGQMILPHVGYGGNFDFTRSPIRFKISERNPARHFQHKHFKTIGNGLAYEAILKYLASIDIDPEALEKDYKTRCFAHVKFFQLLSSQLFNIAQVDTYRRGLLRDEDSFGERKEFNREYINSLQEKKVSIVFAGADSTMSYNEVLCWANADLRLMSYYYLTESTAGSEILQCIAETGLPPRLRGRKQ